MDAVNEQVPNGKLQRRLITANHLNDTLTEAGADWQGDGSAASQVPPPGAASASDTGFPPPPPRGAFAPTALVRPSPTLAPVPAVAPTSQSGDGSTMDLGLYARVMWRFKWVMALGLIIGTAGAYMLYAGVGGGSYSSHAQIFITQPGFTWGSIGQLTQSASGASTSGASTSTTSTTATGSTSSGYGNSVISPYVPGVDPQRLSSLASLYSQLVDGSALRSMLPAAYQQMLNPPSGSPTANLYASAVTAAEYANPAILPLVTVWASAPSPGVASGLATAATTAFQHLVSTQQVQVAQQSRVVAQVVQTATPGKQTGHKSKSLPIMFFLAGLLGAFGLSLVLENRRPRSTSSERTRRLPRKRGRAAAAKVPADAGRPRDAHTEDLSLAEPGA